MATKPLLALCAATALSISMFTPAFADDDAVMSAKAESMTFASLTAQHKTLDTHRYAVKRAAGVGIATAGTAVQSVASSVGARVVSTREFVDQYDIIALDKKLTPAEHDAFVKKLYAQRGVVDVVVDELVHKADVPNDPDYGKLWGLHGDNGARVDRAWSMTQGKGIVVGVVDTGIVPHTDLLPNTLPGYDFVSNATRGRDGDGIDSDPTDEGDWNDANDPDCGTDAKETPSSWHGSHVAGTIAAVKNNRTGVVGVAPEAKIVPVRALGKCGSGSIFDIGYAVTWAAGHNLKDWPVNPNRADVINMSLGGKGKCNNLYQTALNTANKLGAIVVVAAGNSNINISDAMPANCAGVVSVAASNVEGARSYYSNFGDVSVTAPGGDKKVPGGDSGKIWSTVDRGLKGREGDGYAAYQGTSMATPHVAGVVALMNAVNKNLTADQVKDIFRRTSRPMPKACPEGCGPGLIDAEAAVRAAGGRPTESPKPTVKPTSTSTPTSTPTSGPDAIANGDFEQGATGWTGDTNIIATSPYSANSGQYKAIFGNLGQRNTKTLSQKVSVPSNASLRFALQVSTKEVTSRMQYDKFWVKVDGDIVATFSNLDGGSSYVERTVDLTRFAGREVTLSFEATEDVSGPTAFLVDDVRFS